MLGRSCQSVRFRYVGRQKPTQLSFLHGDENVHFIGGFASSRGLVVASPPRRRGPQVRAPWRHGGHGAVDVVGPVVPPGRARGLGNAGVYTNWWKWPLGAVLGHLCTLLRLARVTRESVETQECTQIGKNGLSGLFWGICVHCCDSRGSRTSGAAARLASLPKQQPT